MVIPAYLEEHKVGDVVQKSVLLQGDVRYALEVIVIDDGSNDRTSQMAEAQGAHIIRHPVNCGVEAAIRTGIDWAIANDCDYVAVVSGDDQHVPAEVTLHGIRALPIPPP